jgi:hypothetical protein
MLAAKYFLTFRNLPVMLLDDSEAGYVVLIKDTKG